MVKVILLISHNLNSDPFDSYPEELEMLQYLAPP